MRIFEKQVYSSTEKSGEGTMDIVDINAELHQLAYQSLAAGYRAEVSHLWQLHGFGRPMFHVFMERTDINRLRNLKNYYHPPQQLHSLRSIQNTYILHKL